MHESVKTWGLIVALVVMATLWAPAQESGLMSATLASNGVVCVVSIREDISHNTLFLARRAVKEAVARRAVAIVLDMDTNGGRVDATEEIVRVIARAPMPTFTFVNQKAFSAGAYIAAATDKIFMAPGSVIGAATPILLAPGQEVQKLPESYEEKITSAMRALIRTTAQAQGHNPDVFEAMVDADRGLTVDGHEISPKGKLLTLTNDEASREYGSPPKPLLSAGTVNSVAEILTKLGIEAELFSVSPYGFEILGRLIASISPLLILIGFVAIYIELKAPGIGAPAVVAAICFTIYFVGTFVAGLAGWEEIALFGFGVALIAIEIFILPGFGLAGVLGMAAILASLVLAMTQQWPGGPPWPEWPDLQAPLMRVAIGFGGSVVILLVIARYLPETQLFKRLELSTALTGVTSGSESQSLVGASGVAETMLRPAGKGRFGQQLVDVVTEGDLIPKGAPIRIVETNGSRVVVRLA